MSGPFRSGPIRGLKPMSFLLTYSNRTRVDGPRRFSDVLTGSNLLLHDLPRQIQLDLPVVGHVHGVGLVLRTDPHVGVIVTHPHLPSSLHLLLLFPSYFPSLLTSLLTSLLFLLLFSSVSYDLLFPIPHGSATMGNSSSDTFHSRAPTSLSTSRSGLHNILSAQTRHFAIHNIRSVTRYTHCHIYCTVFLDCQNLSLGYIYCLSLTC